VALLETRGFEVFSAPDEATALAAVDQLPRPRLLLIDLPALNEEPALVELFTYREDTAIIVVCSGVGDPPLPSWMPNLSKPVAPRRLLQSVATAFDLLDRGRATS
jgi:hypothetical protein